MIEWAVIIICVMTLGLVGCEGLNRLNGTRVQEAPKKITIVNAESPVWMEFTGVFTNYNFVELKNVPKEKYKDVYVDITRKGKVNQVQPYSKKVNKEGHPYYVVSDSGGLAFFNIDYGDEYQIFVYK